MHVLRCHVVLAHQRVYVLQVMASVARGYGRLTGISSYFQLFEPCMTGTAGDNPYSTRAKGMQNGVSWFAVSHFSWKRPLEVKFDGQ